MLVIEFNNFALWQIILILREKKKSLIKDVIFLVINPIYFQTYIIMYISFKISCIEITYARFSTPYTFLHCSAKCLKLNNLKGTLVFSYIVKL